MRDFRDQVAINAEIEFEGVPLKKPPKSRKHPAKVPRGTLRFIDTIKYYESYWFESVAEILVKERTFDNTEPPEIRPFDRSDCRMPGGG